jgi:hypothetical protein
LRNPVASDLFGNAGPTPVPDPGLASNLSPWATTTIGGREVLLVSQELGAFVNVDDVENFRDYLEVKVVNAEAERVKEHTRKLEEYRKNMKRFKNGETKTKPPYPQKHVPYQLTPEGIEFLVSLLWPSQSCACLVLFRGLFGLKQGAFHHERVTLAAGQYILMN